MEPKSLKACFEDMPDPRFEHLCSHRLVDIIMIALCGTIAGADSWSEIVEFGEDREEWLRGFLELPNGIPSHDTFERVFARLDPTAFRERFRTWTAQVAQSSECQVIALDGKALRRACNRAEGQGPQYMVSAWATESRLVLGQTKVPEKSNEIVAIPELLSLLDISGCIVTIDAIGCQRRIAQQIIAQKGDYILAVKNNQPDLATKLKRVLGGSTPESSPAEAQYTVAHEKDHGRQETRHCWVIQDEEHLHYVQHGEERWPELNSLIKIQSERTIDGQTTMAIRYYVSSLQASPAELLGAIRSHWGIENSLHWCLDMAFREDESRYRIGHGPENLAVLRHIAMNLLKQDKGAKTGIHARRLRAARSTAYLAKILAY